MGNAKFSDDFKRDAVHQIVERGYPVAEVSRRLGDNRSFVIPFNMRLRLHNLCTGSRTIVSLGILPRRHEEFSERGCVR